VLVSIANEKVVDEILIPNQGAMRAF